MVKKNKTLLSRLNHYIDARFPLLYLETFDNEKADQIIGNAAQANEYSVVEYTARGIFFKDAKIQKPLRKLSEALDKLLPTSSAASSPAWAPSWEWPRQPFLSWPRP